MSIWVKSCQKCHHRKGTKAATHTLQPSVFLFVSPTSLCCPVSCFGHMNGEETSEAVAGRQQLPRLQTLTVTYLTEHESAAVFHISSTCFHHEKSTTCLTHWLAIHVACVSLFKRFEASCAIQDSFWWRGKKTKQIFWGALNAIFFKLKTVIVKICFFWLTAVFQSLHQECVAHALTTKLRLSLTCGHVKTRMWAALLSLHQKHTDETTACDFFPSAAFCSWLVPLHTLAEEGNVRGDGYRPWLCHRSTAQQPGAFRITQDQR